LATNVSTATGWALMGRAGDCGAIVSAVGGQQPEYESPMAALQVR